MTRFPANPSLRDALAAAAPLALLDLVASLPRDAALDLAASCVP
ncbi:hypothetical protein [Limnohabitans sp.]|nr:hypothetical protein [Limnohabitans sp.]